LSLIAIIAFVAAEFRLQRKNAALQVELGRLRREKQ
jgi:hypothetical protein